MRSIGRIAVYATLALGAVSPGGALAQTTLTRTSSFCYDMNIPGASCTYSHNTGLLNQEVVEPNTSALRLETDYVYDSFGNKISVTTSGVDIATRSATSSYSGMVNGQRLYPDGQFQTSAANALGHSENWQYDVRFGKPTSHTGPNGLTTTWQYDTFGRKILEVRPDGTKTTWSYTSFGPGQGYYVMATPQDRNGNQNGPQSWSLFDTLDREYYRCTNGFNTAAVCVQTVYDGFGRIQQKSRPYFYSANNPQWTTYSYDVLARAVTESLPDGHTIQHAYHGLTTSDTNQNNQTRTVTKNSQGQVISVADAQNNVTTYYYDPFGNLVQTVDATGKNVVVNTYDLRGRKTASSDPDLGAWSYSYNTLSQLVSQTDAKSQTSQFIYDLLGRVTQRVETDMTASWTYDGPNGVPTAPNIGKLVSATASGSAAGTNPYQRALTYDSLGRPSSVTTTIDGTGYTISGSYDTNGRLSRVNYPSGFAVNYGYTGLGYAQTITDVGSGATYWTANQRDAELHLLQDTAGNGIVTARGFDAPTGRLTSIVAGSSNGIENFSYTYDGVGNLLTRADANTGVSEGFSYDSLNRLTGSSLSNVYVSSKFFSYDSVGNLLTKSDVGNYAYPEPGLARPHGVLSIDGDAVTATFSYDPNGNQTGATGIGRTVAFNAANRPATITQGALTLNFADDVDHQRYKQTVMQGSAVTTTRYLDAFGVHIELVVSATTQWNDYIMVSGSMVGVRFLQSGTATLRYFHQDHLGSIAVLTDQSGNVVERDAYDPWGKRRFTNGADDPTDSIQSQTIRGFTGQEILASVGLVHLNGRVYDPYIGRMTSADPMVGDPLSGQSWNRYSYVWNNPLAYTDPTGFCPGNCIGTVNPQAPQASGVMGLVESLFKIAVGAMCTAFVPGCAPFLPLVVGITSAYFAGVTSGKLGVALKAGLIAGATAVAFQAVGDLTQELLPVDPDTGLRASMQFGDAAHLFNTAGHALVGCASSAASGGKCGPGALSAAVTAFAGPMINGESFSIGSLLMNTTLGGLASIAGGDKFANGAVTAAFGYLANQAGHQGNDTNARHQMGVDAAIQNYLDRGYILVRGAPTAVDVPGFATPRVYDFIVRDPASGYNIGVEVKTTLYDTIFLNSSQVTKDAMLMRTGGTAVAYGFAVQGVGYQTYCWACDKVDFRSTILYDTLKAKNVPFTHGGRPGEILP